MPYRSLSTEAKIEQKNIRPMLRDPIPATKTWNQINKKNNTIQLELKMIGNKSSNTKQAKYACMMQIGYDMQKVFLEDILKKLTKLNINY